MLRLMLLGELQITLNDQPVTGFDSNKARALLCYLAVTGQTHFRASLLGLLWGEMPETEAKANLRTTLSNLRKLVGDHLDITRQTAAFNQTEPHWLDVNALIQGADLDCEIPELETVAALYHGDFLAGFQVKEAYAFEEWVLMQRERFREIAIQLLHTIVTHYTTQGPRSYQTAITYIRRLLELEPWREEAHRQLMLVLARTGQRSAALAQYQTCQRLLKDELEIEPMPETQKLYQRIRAIGTGPRHNLPLQPTKFVGRETELERIAEHWANPACRLLTLLGPGGVGKTRLAMEAASQHLSHFFEGVYFVALASVTEPGLLVSTLANAINFTFYSKQSPRTQLLNYLQEKELLLILDNFEYLLPDPQAVEAEALDLLAEILSHAPGVTLLITSRERLNLRSEWLLEVEGLIFPEPASGAYKRAKQWANYSALQLFYQRARQLQAQSLSEGETAAVAHICQLVEGLPLGIELAATWSRNYSFQEIGQQIERNLDFLATTQRDMPARHRSLRAVFDHSWQILPDQEQLILERLTIFQGNFSREAAETVIGATLPVLSALIDKSLLRREGAGRYEIHQMIRQYGVEKLQEAPLILAEVQAIHSRYYLNFIRAREAVLKGNQRQTVLAEIAQEIDNIRSAWLWVVAQNDFERIDECLDSLYTFYSLQSWYQEGAEAFMKAAEALSGVPQDTNQTQILLFGRIICRQGSLQTELAQYQSAQAQLEQGIATFRQFDALRDLAFALERLGVLMSLQGLNPEAKQALEESLVIYRTLADEPAQAGVLVHLGFTLCAMGTFEQSKACYEQSLQIYRELDDQPNLAWVLDNLGMWGIDTGNYDEAKTFLEESLTISQAVGHDHRTAYVLNHLGSVVGWVEGYEQAETYLEESLMLARKVGDRRLMTYCLGEFGSVHYAKADYTAAIQAYQEALVIFEEMGEQYGRLNCFASMALTAVMLEDYAAAKTYFREALTIALDTDSLPRVMEVITNVAYLLSKEGQATLAVTLITYVLEDPRTIQGIREFIDEIKPDIVANLSSEALAQAEKRGRALSFDEVVAIVFDKIA